MSQQQTLNIVLSNNSLKGIGYKYYALTIILISLFLRFYSLTDRFFWGDESSSVLTSRYDLGALLYHASFDVHPPLYYLLLHGWIELFGDNILAVRSLSLTFGVMTVALAMHFTRWFANERAALLAGWLMAIMPIAVRYSQEARMYTLMGLLVLAATMALAMWLKTPGKRGYMVLYAVFMTLSFYTHYFTIFTLIAHWFVVLIVSFRREGECYVWQPRWWLANAAIAVAYIPWLLVLFNLLAHIAELRVGGDVGWIPKVTWSDLPAMYWHFLAGNDGSIYPSVMFWLLPIFFLGLCALLLMQRQLPEKFSLLLIGSILIPITLVFLISCRMPLFIDRYLYSAALGIPIVLGLLIGGMKSRAGLTFLLVFFSLLFGYGVVTSYPEGKDDFKSMMSYINNNYQPGDAVVVSNMSSYLSYVYYNKKNYRALLYTPVRPGGTSGQPNAYGFGTFFHNKVAQTYVDNLSVLPGEHRRIWLVSSGNFNQDFGQLPPGWASIASFKRGDFESQLFIHNVNVMVHRTKESANLPDMIY